MNKSKRMISMLLCFALFISTFSCLTCVESFAATPCCTIIFKPNGGTGNMDSQEPATQNTKINANKFEYEGRYFAGWYVYNTMNKRWLYTNNNGDYAWHSKDWTNNKQGKGYFRARIDDKSNVSVLFNLGINEGDTVQLYASWGRGEPDTTYTIVYDANGGEGSMDNDVDVINGVEKALRKNTFTRQGYTFVGWTITRSYDDAMHYTLDRYGRAGGTKKRWRNPENEKPGEDEEEEPAEEDPEVEKSGDTTPVVQASEEEESEDTTPVVQASEVNSNEGFAKTIFDDEYVLKGLDLKDSKTLTCKAQWKLDTTEEGVYIVEYDANGGTGKTMEQTILRVGEATPIRKNTYVREGYNFAGWNIHRRSDDPSRDDTWMFRNADQEKVSWYTYGDQAEGYKLKLYKDEIDINKSKENNDLLTFYAVWKPKEEKAIYFHSNIPSDSEGNSTENSTEASNDYFRIYYSGVDGYDDVDSNNRIPKFEEIPKVKGYAFKGWYIDPENDNDDNPISWDDVYDFEKDTHIYAHWLEVKKDEANRDNSDFELQGVQIRQETPDASSGLRFVAVLQESFINSLDSLYPDNDNDDVKNVKYGFLAANNDKLKGLNGDIVYGGAAKPLECTSSAKGTIAANSKIYRDHRNTDTYRLYTLVITYKDESLKEKNFTARAYVQYKDANGTNRYYYDTYTGYALYHGGCYTSYNNVLSRLSTNPEA